MGLDRPEAGRVMGAVRQQAEEVRGAREKVKEPRVEVRKAGASRRRFCNTKAGKAVWKALTIESPATSWPGWLNSAAQSATA